MLLRTGIGSIALIAIFFLTGHRPTFQHNPKHALSIIVSGISMGACWILLFRAYDLLGVGVATIFYYVGPVIIVLLSPLVFHERLTVAKLVGIGVVICGIIMINGSGSHELNPQGVVVGLLSAVAFAVTIVFNKRATRITGLENATLQLVIAFIAVAVYVGIVDGFAMDIRPGDWFPILLLGIINTGFACFLYFMPISHLPAQTISVLGYLEPVSAVVLSLVILHQPLSGLEIAGAILVIGGAVFCEWSQSRRKDIHGTS